MHYLQWHLVPVRISNVDTEQPEHSSVSISLTHMIADCGKGRCLARANKSTRRILNTAILPSRGVCMGHAVPHRLSHTCPTVGTWYTKVSERSPSFLPQPHHANLFLV